MKFVSVLNKKGEMPRLLNAIAHTTVGVAGSVKDQDSLALTGYRHKGGDVFSVVSDNPFIILRASGNELRKLVGALIEAGVTYSAFTDSMVFGGAKQQKLQTAAIEFQDLNFLVVTCFGPDEIIGALTKKFSIWK